MTRFTPFVVTGANKGKRLVYDESLSRYEQTDEELSINNPIGDMPEIGSRVWAVFRGQWEIVPTGAGAIGKVYCCDTLPDGVILPAYSFVLVAIPYSVSASSSGDYNAPEDTLGKCISLEASTESSVKQYNSYQSTRVNAITSGVSYIIGVTQGPIGNMDSGIYANIKTSGETWARVERTSDTEYQADIVRRCGVMPIYRQRKNDESDDTKLIGSGLLVGGFGYQLDSMLLQNDEYRRDYITDDELLVLLNLDSLPGQYEYNFTNNDFKHGVLLTYNKEPTPEGKIDRGRVILKLRLISPVLTQETIDKYFVDGGIFTNTYLTVLIQNNFLTESSRDIYFFYIFDAIFSPLKYDPVAGFSTKTVERSTRNYFLLTGSRSNANNKRYFAADEYWCYNPMLNEIIISSDAIDATVEGYLPTRPEEE
ncbi:MAG: hypothetical protein ACRC2T_19510 [Thermoguttaceae bacterium]